MTRNSGYTLLCSGVHSALRSSRQPLWMTCPSLPRLQNRLRFHTPHYRWLRELAAATARATCLACVRGLSRGSIFMYLFPYPDYIWSEISPCSSWIAARTESVEATLKVQKGWELVRIFVVLREMFCLWRILWHGLDSEAASFSGSLVRQAP